MTPSQKLELARAAVEFAEASIDRVVGPTWTISGNGGGGGDIGFDRYSIPHALFEGKSVEEIKVLLEAGAAKRKAFDEAWNRIQDRLTAAKKRYLAARAACGFREIPK